MVIMFALFFVLIGCSHGPRDTIWTQEHIASVPPIMMKDPFLELLGQTDKPIPYYYHEAVKLAGHSCGAVAGAWIITGKALKELYPRETPVRGQIMVEAPGAEDEWLVGVFGEVISYITGAAPRTGFPGAGFAKGSKRKDLLIYKDTETLTPPPEMVWIFKRIDTGAQVGVSYNLSLIQPPATAENMGLGKKVGKGKATSEEIKAWTVFWNSRVEFIFNNADRLEGLFTVSSANN